MVNVAYLCSLFLIVFFLSRHLYYPCELSTSFGLGKLITVEYSYAADTAF